MAPQMPDESMLSRAAFAAGLALLMVVALEFGFRRMELHEPPVILIMVIGYLAAAAIGGLAAALIVKQRRLRLVVVAQLIASVLSAILV